MKTHARRSDSRRTRHGRVSAVAAIFCCCALPAQADSTVTYDYVKGIILDLPDKQPGDTVTATLLHAEKVWTQEPKAGLPFRCNQDPNVVPCVQKGQLPNMATVAIPATGLPSTIYAATLVPAPNSANADVTIAVNPIAAKAGAVTAGLVLTGEAIAKAPLGTTTSVATANSGADLQAFLNNLGRGTVTLGAFVHMQAGSANGGNQAQISGKNQTVIGDPVNFRLTDLASGQVTTGTLFDLTLSLNGTGVIDWNSDAGTLVFGTGDASSGAELHIDMGSPFTTRTGHLDLIVDHGIVSTSSGTGAFAGLGPAVGTSGAFSMPLASPSFGFDFSSATHGPTDLVLDFADQGHALASDINPVPEPVGSALWSLGGLCLAWMSRRQIVRSGAVEPG